MKIKVPKIWEGSSKRTRIITGTVRSCQYVRKVGDQEKCLFAAAVEDIKTGRIFCERCVYNLSRAVRWEFYIPLNDTGKEILGFKRRT